MPPVRSYLFVGGASGALIAAAVAAFLSITALVSETTLPDGTQVVPPPPGTLHVGTSGDGATSESPAQVTGPGPAISAPLGLPVPTSSATGAASPLAPSEPGARKSGPNGPPSHGRGPAKGDGRGPGTDNGSRQGKLPDAGATEPSGAVASKAEPDHAPVLGPAGNPGQGGIPPGLAASPPRSPAAPAGSPPGLAKKPAGAPPGLAKKPGGLPRGQAKKR